MSTAPDLEPDAQPLEKSKPPFLRRVRIRNYKSIAFCDVTLEPLTILVGRNASGKSNFLDALGLLKDLVDMRVPDAVKSRGGWNAVHRRGDPTGVIDFEIEATVGRFPRVCDVIHAFRLAPSPHNSVHVEREALVLTQRWNGRRWGYQMIGGDISWVDHNPFDGGAVRDPSGQETTGIESLASDPRFQGPFRGDRLQLSLIGPEPLLDLAEGFRASLVCNFSPPAIRSWNPRGLESTVTWDGRDLATELEMIREIEPAFVKRIERFLGVMVDGVGGLRTAKYGEHERVEFCVAPDSRDSAEFFDASSMSDGTLRILASLVAAYRVYLPTPASGFLGIEEPETSLHPAAVRALVDALDEATLRKQILLTTHSAELLDNPTIQPGNIRVVEMIDGQTIIARVDEASVEIVKQKLDTLGGLERQNQLQADFLDVDRQRRLSQNGRGPRE